VKTVQELQVMQNHLIQSEKMVVLGQLIARIAHDINTPLAAIHSSMENVIHFLDHTLAELPQFFRSLSEAVLSDFMLLLQRSLQKREFISFREKRALKKRLTERLETEKVTDARITAYTLTEIGVGDEIEEYISFLKQQNHLSLLDMVYKLSSVHRSMETIQIAGDRATQVISALKNYARFDLENKPKLANLTQGIDTALILHQSQIQQKVEVIRNYQLISLVRCYPDELNQVWSNLIQNALQSMQNDGRLVIDVSQTDQTVQIVITDNGSGIPTEIQAKIFDPFFTTKSSKHGTGLGLDIVRRIVDQHHGQISVTSQPGRTAFTIVLPLNFDANQPVRE
jgi:two-component system, NtrC family, sensor kinase